MTDIEKILYVALLDIEAISFTETSRAVGKIRTLATEALTKAQDNLQKEKESRDALVEELRQMVQRGRVHVPSPVAELKLADNTYEGAKSPEEA